MRKRCWFLTITLVALFLSLAGGLSAAPYYEGKRITIIVGSDPGGGNDRMARILARHLPKYIPGKPTIIIENMGGAASMVAANHMFNIAKPDGQTIGTFLKGFLYSQLLKADGVKFDLMKYSWIGSTAKEATILTYRTNLPVKTIEDLKNAKEPFYLASTGQTTSEYQFCTFLKIFLGLKANFVFYPSSSACILAVERKEVDGRPGSFSSLKPFIEQGLVRPLVRGRVSEAGIENLPVDEDLTADPLGKTMMAMRSAADNIGRPYVTPPGTPAAVLNILRDAFGKVMKDPELRVDAKKNMMEMEYMGPEECLKVLNYVFNQPDETIKEFGKYVKF